jgi:hypothetical protein
MRRKCRPTWHIEPDAGSLWAQGVSQGAPPWQGTYPVVIGARATNSLQFALEIVAATVDLGPAPAPAGVIAGSALAGELSAIDRASASP